MIEKPQIRTISNQLTAVIHLTIPHAQMRNVMGPGINELMATLMAQGIPPEVPIFTHHFRLDPEIFDFEIGVLVQKPFTVSGRVKLSQLPGGLVAQTVYQGPYEGLSDAWEELDTWIQSQGHQAKPEFWECYIFGARIDPGLQWLANGTYSAFSSINRFNELL